MTYEEKIKELLKLQSMFTKRQWYEALEQINAQYSKKADKLQLTDLDIKEISNRISD